MAGNTSSNPLALFQQAQALHREGKFGLAESHYLRVVKLDPNHADAWHLLGVLAYQTGNTIKAIKHYRRAVEIRPGFAQAFNNLALAHKARSENSAALQAFERALAIRPEYVEAAFNVALLHETEGNPAAAEKAYRHALAIRPEYLDALINLGNLLRRQHRASEARDLLAPTQRMHSEHAALAGNLALIHLDLGDYAPARSLGATAARLAPQEARWWEVQGVAARLQNDLDAALPLLARARQLAPEDAGKQFEYGLALESAGDYAQACSVLGKARAAEPQWQRLRWSERLLLPTMPNDEAAVDAALVRFGQGLEDLHAGLKLDTPAAIASALDAAAATCPFQLHYLPRDNSVLQQRYAELVQRVALAAAPQFACAPTKPQRAPGAKLRIGFVSAYLRTHTVARYFSRYITDLDTTRFETFVWHTGDSSDALTESIAAASTHYLQTDRLPLSLAQMIRAADLDALIYLDIGLDPRQLLLASWRLAPLQCLAYGHPVSSGLPSIDYFLGADALEPTHAQKHYREKLLSLPGLGARPAPPPVAGDGAWLRENSPNKPVLLCLQNLIKLVPEFDRILACIAARSGARIVLFDRCAHLGQIFMRRIAPAFAAEGLRVEDSVELLPLRVYSEFLGGVQAADLVLDTPWFCGGGTSLDALGVGTPVVTLEGPMARGRQTAGMLRLLGIDELITTDADAYVELVVALCADKKRRDDLRLRISQSAEKLFNDPTPLTALQVFLRGAV
ncbi:tetratricopeptide repeat protein [Pseudolysobacter antarcticus]|uniref:protein O-GlcNAc transferase n=1 Tax=Pseudolysobacter antarcticus TaxID=2511995 RepID=A0A411HHU0_9GAMM|nr:tetratricopeptide repeat protein [Pseudolysobacter antarcticus]QBB70051.1 tetratricopeptide repeat protein [Pseudolysobacter antarcticus]